MPGSPKDLRDRVDELEAERALRSRFGETHRDAALDLFHLAASAASLGELGSGACAAVRVWTGCDAAGLLLPPEETIEAPRWVGLPGPLCAAGEAEAGAAVLAGMGGRVLAGGLDAAAGWVSPAGSFQTDDLPGLLNAEPDLGTMPDLVLWSPDLTSLTMVPLRASSGVVGLLVIGHLRAGPSHPGSQLLIERVADGIAAGVARLAAERWTRRLASRLAEVEEAEKRRLARLLHDEVGQSLSALGMTISYVAARVAGEEAERLMDAIGRVERLAGRIRDVMSDLRPALLEDFGLGSALEAFGRQFATRTGLEVAVRAATPSPRLPAEAEAHLFRVAQEALTNVAKHAQATRVRVQLDGPPSMLRLSIEDDGVGFDPGTAPTGGGGWGLTSMRERAAAVGGELTVDSKPGRGTRIVVSPGPAPTED